jgi:hypothetical protein
MRSLLFLLSLASLACGVGCPAEDPCAAEEPSYGGDGNDEVWLTLKERKADATIEGDAPTIIKPADAAVLPKATVPTFEWESPLKIALGPHAPSPLYKARAPSSLQRAFASLGDVVLPKAHAHQPPVSSDVYLADILVPGRECPVSIVTTELSHPLDADSWAILQESAGEELTLQLTSAYLSSGNISEGPFKAADVTFKVE